jgi:hypothetical protein
MKKIICLLVFCFCCFDLFARPDSFYSPIEYKKVYFLNDGTYFVESYKILSDYDSIELKNLEVKWRRKADSTYKAEFMKQLPQFKKGNIQRKKIRVIQFLAKLDRKSNEQFRASISINGKRRDTIDVDFKIKDTLFKDFTPILYRPIEGLYTIDLDVFSDSLLKTGSNTNGYYNTFDLISVFREEELIPIVNHLQKYPFSWYNYFRFDSFPVHDWTQEYQPDQLDTSIHYPYMHYDSLNHNYSVNRQYILTPRTLNTRTDEVFYFLFNGLPETDYFEYKIAPWILYDDSHIPWQKNTMGSSLLKISFPQTGIYVLRVRNAHFPRWSFMQIVHVNPRWYQTPAFKICIIVFICGAFLLLLFRNYRRKQRRKLFQIEQEKDEISINLQSVRSQLNPHFIFNALSSIQGLISTQKYEKANEYLVSFSKMLRKPMDPAELKHWSLADEIGLLQDYIKIEQLRKTFAFTLIIDEHIETSQINFPALLLQPVVENAIKHGLQGGDESLLTLSFNKKDKSLEIILKDNGVGFDTSISYEGKGLQLTQEYMALVNRQFAASNIDMQINSTLQGTAIIFTFLNWLDES